MYESYEYDPLTGLIEKYQENSDGTATVSYTQASYQPYLDTAAGFRNSGLTDDNWKKTGATLYAMIPWGVVLALGDKGIDVFNPNNAKRVFDEINSNYPHLKTTDKHHALVR